MNADQFLALAEALRSYAQLSARDLNQANLFVHDMLMRVVKLEPVDPPRREREEREAA